MRHLLGERVAAAQPVAVTRDEPVAASRENRRGPGRMPISSPLFADRSLGRAGTEQRCE